MKFIDKLKDMFLTEDGTEDVIQKEVHTVKIPTPVGKKESKVEEESIVDEIEEEIEKDAEEEKIEKVPVRIEEPKKEIPQPKKNIPTFYDDGDFEMLDNLIQSAPKKEEPKIVKQEYKYTKTETMSPLRPTSLTSTYGIKKDGQKKVFTPSPIISPVYGVLDKNYRKEEITQKKKSKINYSEYDRVDVDDVRKKAYGTLEDELEDSFDIDLYEEEFPMEVEETENKKTEESPIDIFEELEIKREEKEESVEPYAYVDEMKNKSLDDLYNESAAEDLLDEFLSRDYDKVPEEMEEEVKPAEEVVKPKRTRTKKEEKTEDVQNYEKYEEELNKSYTTTTDEDLFNLIDSMYRDREGE